MTAAAGAPGPGIQVQGVTVTYPNGHTALREASFEMPTGSITALVGINNRQRDRKSVV